MPPSNRGTLGQLSEKNWQIASLTILAVAAFLRFYDLDLVPLHHDEGVNGNFLVRLVREGAYEYDPANYHGPTLYYFSAIIPWTLRFLFGISAQNTYGLTTSSIRLIPVLFGLGTVLLALQLRRRLGMVGALTAAGLIALSPGAVYLSRYFIHETLFVFFTLGIVVALLDFYDDGHPVYLLLAAISAALLFATKETAIISVGVLFIAFITMHFYHWFHVQQLRDNRNRGRGKKGESDELRHRRSFSQIYVNVSGRVGGTNRLIIWALAAMGVFIGLNVLFYSSFFTNYPKGVTDALKTFEFWTKTGREAHVHDWTTYLRWLGRQESPLLFLGTIGAAVVVARPRNLFALFCALWAFGLIAAYSLIAYKTPWLTLNFIVPLALIGGYAVQYVSKIPWIQSRDVIVLLVLAVAISGFLTIDLNFRNYDNDKPSYVYVYAHTHRETLKLVEEINRIAKETGHGGQMGITIVSPDYWPLPWYLRDYARVGYHGRITDTNEPVIIASETQRAEVQERFGFRYQLLSTFNPSGTFVLRPGVKLLLFMRRDLEHQ